MNFIISIIRTLFLPPLVITGWDLYLHIVCFLLHTHMRGGYDVKATLYTGVASGYNLES